MKSWFAFALLVVFIFLLSRPTTIVYFVISPDENLGKQQESVADAFKTLLLKNRRNSGHGSEKNTLFVYENRDIFAENQELPNVNVVIEDFSKQEGEKKLFQNFKEEFEKVYKNAKEEELRKKIFLNNIKTIEEHNQEDSAFAWEITQFSDWLPKELKTLDCLRRLTPEEERWLRANVREFRPRLNEPIPEEIDWTKYGCVTAVKNQMTCGSCWAFASTGTIEGQHKRKTGKLVSLSEQNLLDCAENGGCEEGGSVQQAFQYVITNRGIDTEQSYPYVNEKNPECRFNRTNIGATVKGLRRIPEGDENALKIAVATKGPISVSIDASDLRYRKLPGENDIYDNPKCSTRQQDLNHAVLVVGYGKTADGIEYWKIKNSWGAQWGYKGYTKFARNKGNMCGIASRALYPIV